MLTSSVGLSSFCSNLFEVRLWVLHNQSFTSSIKATLTRISWLIINLRVLKMYFLYRYIFQDEIGDVK